MAFLFGDSFDHYVTADVATKWTASNVSFQTLAISAGNGRRSTASLRVTVAGSFSPGTYAYLSKTLTPGDTNVTLGFSVTASALGSAGIPLCAIADAGTPQITLVMNSDGTLGVKRGTSSGTVLGTSSAVLSAGVAAHLQLKVLIHNSAGTVDLRMNNVSILSLSGLDTQNTGNTSWNQVYLGACDTVWSSTGTINLDFDDLWVLDGTGSINTGFQGDLRADCLYPTAEGNTIMFTPSTGSDNALTIDETAPNSSDYNTGSAANDKDTFITTNVPGGATPYFYQVSLYAKKSDSGTCTAAPVIRSGGTDYVGASLSPGTAYAYLLTPYDTDPATGARPTEAGANAFEIGYKRLT